MYKRVEAQLVLSGLSRKELAASLGISYNTLNSKLNGKSAFLLDEAIKVKRILCAEDPIEKLFEMSEVS